MDTDEGKGTRHYRELKKADFNFCLVCDITTENRSKYCHSCIYQEIKKKFKEGLTADQVAEGIGVQFPRLVQILQEHRKEL